MAAVSRTIEFFRRQWWSIVGVLLIVVLGADGCGGGDDDSDSSVTPTSITIEEEREWSNDDSVHEWTSPGPVARLQLYVDDFNHGDMMITIYDAQGETIFSKVYWSFDGWWYIDWEFSDIDFTDSGAPGLWTIVLEYAEFTGEITLVVESTTEPPTEPEVPAPTSNSQLLDLAFGDDGRAAYTPHTSGARRIAFDSAGRAAAAGTIVDSEGVRRLSVWRFTAAGALDTGFGSGGVFSYNNASVAASGGTGIAVDSSNRILVSGWVGDENHRMDLAVMRLTTAGVLDTNFGSGGVVTLDNGEDEVGNGVIIDTSGRVLVAGSSRTADNDSGCMLLARLTSAGAFDAGFADDGVYRSLDTGDRGWNLALATNNRPVVVGYRTRAMVLWRFDADGTLDTTFGEEGIVVSAGDADEYRIGRALAVQADGTAWVVGFRIYDNAREPEEMLIWAFTSTGDPKVSFSGDGFLSYRYPNGYAAATGIEIDGSGRLLVCGATRTSGTGDTDASATIWRFYATGMLDGTLLGSNGTGITRIDPRPDDAGTIAGGVVLGSGSSAFASGTAFHRTDGAADAIVWKLRT
jgi:uncharacterized delta-60 repeat protein